MGGGGRGNEETLLFWNILSSHRVLVIAESVVFGTFTAGLLIDDFRAASCPVRGCPGASENPPPAESLEVCRASRFPPAIRPSPVLLLRLRLCQVGGISE